MKEVRTKRKIPSEEDIENMIRYRKQGKTYQEIEKIVGFHYSTVYKFVKNIDVGRGKYKHAIIIDLLENGKSVKEIVSLAKVTAGYVRKVQESKAVEKILIIQEEVEKVSNNRKKEIQKINKELKRLKQKQEKEWEEQLNREKEYQVERYPYAFK